MVRPNGALNSAVVVRSEPSLRSAISKYRRKSYEKSAGFVPVLSCFVSAGSDDWDGGGFVPVLSAGTDSVDGDVAGLVAIFCSCTDPGDGGVVGLLPGMSSCANPDDGAVRKKTKSKKETLHAATRFLEPAPPVAPFCCLGFGEVPYCSTFFVIPAPLSSRKLHLNLESGKPLHAQALVFQPSQTIPGALPAMPIPDVRSAMLLDVTLYSRNVPLESTANLSPRLNITY